MSKTAARNMIVSCPSCETRFNLDGAAFKNGRRRVRCGRCGTKWTVTDPRAEPLFTVDEDPFPQPRDAAPGGMPVPDLDMEAVAAQRARAALSGRDLDDDDDDDDDVGSGSARRALLVALALLVIGGLAGGGYYAMQQGLLDGVAPAAFDSDAPGVGDLTIDENATRVRLIGQDRDGTTVQVFEVTGLIRNDTDGPLRVPPMIGRFQDAQGRALFYNDDPARPAEWPFSAPAPALQPGETARFRTIVDVAAAPARAENIEISFGE